MPAQVRSSRLHSLALAFVLPLVAVAANASTLHIRANGSGDAPTIKAGVALAAVGDTVLVESGTYFEDSVVVAKNLTITGPGSGWPVIRGRSSQTILRSMPGTTPTFQRLVLANADVGIQARNDAITCGGAGANMIVREVVLDSCAVGIDADDSACIRGTATLDRCTAYRCGVAYAVNDYGTVTATNLVAAFCGTALSGEHYGSASFSCLVLWQNGVTSAGPQPIVPSSATTADPRLCDPGSGNFGVGPASACLPANNSCGQQIGALGASCIQVTATPAIGREGFVLLVLGLGVTGMFVLQRRRRLIA